MKRDVMGIGAPINKEELKELLKETKETIAVDANLTGTTTVYLVQLICGMFKENKEQQLL